MSQHFCLHEFGMQPETALIAVWILQSVLCGFNYRKSCYILVEVGGGEVMNTMMVVHSACIMLCILFISLSIPLASHKLSG
jgi:hypothetical protein